MSNEKQTVTLRFSKDTYLKCQELAKLDHRSLNNFIERLMEKAIGKKEILTHLED